MNISILEKWQESGLLDGLDEYRKQIVAEKLEEASNFLTAENCPIKNNSVDIVAFPAIRRVLKDELDSDLNIPDFLSELAFDYNRAVPEFNDMQKNDSQVDFLITWCENFVNNNLPAHKKRLNEEVSRWKKLAGIDIGRL